ncbi:hypothetical protein BDM02DRAFT_1675995 [Thelephora ganbajun]|uniref:Uncharacterized protein n=1 Tax=Thelephora ganbajun TaxID=370292 RepID=A0ACB6ZWA8_THEGA|nr:hypothetical protein BDM02DRAFT_1675995 [Thelephora ganbajun]
MFQLPKTPHRPTTQNRLPPSPRRKRFRNEHPSRSPPRLRGSKVYRRRVPGLRPTFSSFTQDASPVIGSNDSPYVSYETMNPSSPSDRYNPTRKTAYKQLMIDYAPSSSKLLSLSTSGNHGQSKHTETGSGSQRKVTSGPKRTKFLPPEKVDDGVFFSSDPASSTSLGLFGYLHPITLRIGPVIIPTLKHQKEPAHTSPPLSFALHTDALDLPSPYYRFQADSTTDDHSTNLPHPTYPISLAHCADEPAFAYYTN